MTQTRKIEIFSAGCATCKETIAMMKKLAGPDQEVQIHDMHQHDVAARAKQHGVRSLPAMMVDGKLAGCCAGRGPDEGLLRDLLS
jgi:glutaredoxin